MKMLIAGMLAGLFAVSGAPVILYSECLALSSGGAKDQIYSHNAKGLQKQFEPFLKAVEKGDEAKLKESFAVFALPDPAAWFAQYFAKDQVQQLVWDNESEVDTYRTSLNMLLRRFLKGSHYDVHCELNSEVATTLRPRANAIAPLAEVPIERYNIRFLGEGGHSMGQLANFVYVDGAFRYLGKGSYPFWSMPDATAKPAN